MTVVTVEYAQVHLSRLIAEVEAGGEVTIARGEAPAIELRLAAAKPDETPKPQRKFGAWKGLISLDESFFDPLPDDELALWNGEGD